MPLRSGASRRDARHLVRRRERIRRLAVVSAVGVTALAINVVVDPLPSPGSAAPLTTRLPDLLPSRYPTPAVARERAPSVDPSPATGENAAAVPAPTAPAAPPPDVKPPATAALPADSGSGTRVVYAIGAQQVWLVSGSDVARTYRVSGSRYDQLAPGTYEVFSRSRHATSWHGTETMEYMVRFHQGARANIGFHDIPVDVVSGAEVQTLSDLGTPLSDGCIRQDVVDAAALWEFSTVGTPVVVLP
jgi:lipoprotein-anchoring transpeptidase ErfK/SrfK